MGGDDITQIKVGTNRVGIIGLKTVLQDLSSNDGVMPEDEIKKTLMDRLGKRNYIAPQAREKYETAFYREFCKFTGKPFHEEALPGVIEIKILGKGCMRCDQLEREVMEIVAEMNVPADIEHIRDLKQIAEYGVLGSPALVISGEVKAVGRVPKRRQIMDWLKSNNKNLIIEEP